MVSVTVPDLGDAISKVQVVSWHAKQGARVRQDDDLVECVTDKAVFNVPAPADGILHKIEVEAGQEAAIGAVLGFIE